MKPFSVVPLVVLYVGYLLVITLYPFAFTANSSAPLAQSFLVFLTATPQGIKGIGGKDFVYNVFFFVPFGVLLYGSLKCPQRTAALTICITAVAGGILSFAIELSQIFFARHPSASDVFANTFGSAFGALLCAACPIRIGRVFSGFRDKLVSSKVFLLMVLLYGSLPLILSAIESPWPNFRTWNSQFAFQIGNEATLDRPWLGTIYLVALYNRALSATEVAEHFQLGFSGDATKRRSTEDLVALYTFSECEGDRVYDLSPMGMPLNLSLIPRSHVRWLSSCDGIEILQPAIIESERPAKKLVEAFRGRDEMSIEAWFAPGNLIQKGPARLVSFSGDLSSHNFTLGQQGEEVMFWLRTLVSGRTGSPDSLQTRTGFLRFGISHVVATYARGVERIYANGAKQSDLLDVTKDVIIGFGTRKTPIAQIAYSFFFFFPVSLFFSLFLSSRGVFNSSLLLPVALGTGLLAITEIFQAFAFNRDVDFPLMGYGVIIATIGSLMGPVFSYRE